MVYPQVDMYLAGHVHYYESMWPSEPGEAHLDLDRTPFFYVLYDVKFIDPVSLALLRIHVAFRAGWGSRRGLGCTVPAHAVYALHSPWLGVHGAC